MKLSTLYTSVPEYIEFGWVCSPNAAAQTISRNVVTLVTLNAEVADTANLVSAPVNNQFTLPAGTYYFEAETTINRGDNNSAYAFLGLRIVGSSNWITRGVANNKAASGNTVLRLVGQFVISTSTVFELTILAGGTADPAITSTVDSTAMTNSTSDAAQRVSVKLWKLK